MPMSGSAPIGSEPQLAPSTTTPAWHQPAPVPAEPVMPALPAQREEAPAPPPPNTFAQNTGYDLTLEGEPMRDTNVDAPTPADLNRDPADAEIDADPIAQQMIAQLERMGIGPNKAVELDAPGQAQTQPAAVDPAAGDAGLAGEGAPDALTESAPAEVPPATAADSNLSVDFGEYGKVDVNADYARELLLQDAWIKQKPEQTWQVLNALEQGQAYAITADDYALLQRAKSGQLAPSASPPKLSDEEAQYLSPEALAHVRRLEAQAAQSVAPTPPSQQQTQGGPVGMWTNPQQVAQQTAQQIQRANSIQATFDAGTTKFRTDHGLTDPEWNELSQFVQDGQHVSRAVQRHTFRNPDGSEAYVDHARALEEGLNEAYMVHPKFRERMIQAEAQRRLDAAQGRTSAANEKKTRASSLAAAPSAAITTPSSQPGAPTRQQLVADIADVIRASRSGTG